MNGDERKEMRGEDEINICREDEREYTTKRKRMIMRENVTRKRNESEKGEEVRKRKQEMGKLNKCTKTERRQKRKRGKEEEYKRR